MAFIAENGVILREVELRTTPNGHKVVEVPVFFNDYQRGIGNTTLETKVTVWGDKAQWLYDQAQKHTKKDGTQTFGKGMPMFFIGEMRTNKYEIKSGQNAGQQVRENLINAVEVTYSEVPVMNAVGVIGAEVQPRTVNKKDGTNTLVVEVPVFFNGFYPNKGKGPSETYVEFWGDRAQWLYDQAQKHTNKDGAKTGGKGMRVKLMIYLLTEEYQKDGVTNRVTKAVAADAKFPSSVFGVNPNANQNSNQNNYNTNHAPAQTQTQTPPQQEAPPTTNNEPPLSFDEEFNIDLGGDGSEEDILSDFMNFVNKNVDDEENSA